MLVSVLVGLGMSRMDRLWFGIGLGRYRWLGFDWV